MVIRRIMRVVSRKNKIVPVVKPKKICVFKPGAIGDVLMTTPFLKALRQRFPNAKIDYWVGKLSAPMLAGNKNVDRVIVFDETNALNKRAIRMLMLANSIRRENYDIFFMMDFHYLANVFAASCRVPITIGFDRDGEGFPLRFKVPYGPVKHQMEYYLDLAYLVGAKRIKPQIELALSKADKSFAQQFFKEHRLNPKKTIAFAPGGAKNPGQEMAIRRWPVGRFAEVAKTLAKQGWQILLLGKAPGDSHVLPEMMRAVPNAVNAIADLTYKQSAALMQLSRVLVCNDSGPMHVAAAVGTPTVSVFGPTDPQRKAPIGPKHLWVWNRIDNVHADAYSTYEEPFVRNNILKVQPQHVLKAVHKLVK